MRLPRLLPSEMNAEQRRVYESIACGRRSQGEQSFRITGSDGALEGPFAALLISPDFGLRIADVGEAIRYRGTLPAAVRELLILLVARDRRSNYEWYAHASVARSLGFTEGVLDKILHGELPRELGDNEAIAAALYHHVQQGTSVSNELYEAAERTLGESGILEVVTLVHYYNLLAGLLTVFAIDLPRGVTKTF